MFDWLENIFEEGSEIIIPAGAKEIAADGTESVIQVARKFTYAPGSKQPGQVLGFFSANRHLITAKGVSHLGLDSAMGVGPNVLRHELEVTSEQLDYLIGQIAAKVI